MFRVRDLNRTIITRESIICFSNQCHINKQCIGDSLMLFSSFHFRHFLTHFSTSQLLLQNICKINETHLLYLLSHITRYMIDIIQFWYKPDYFYFDH